MMILMVFLPCVASIKVPFSLLFCTSLFAGALSGEIIEITSRVTHHHYSTDEKEKLVEEFNKPIRKIAHASVYFVLSILVLNFLLALHSNLEKKYVLVFFMTIFICFLFALTDEYHQTFVYGRTGQFSDVLIDTSGALIAASIFTILYKKKKK